MIRTCWCGASPSAPLGDAYALCDVCGSVICTDRYDVDDYTSTSRETAFYGARYWSDHVPNELGLPGLETRARTDLTERAIYYLDRALVYLAPGNTVLELGCAPGSLGYLFARAGLQVTGVELGKTTVEFVRRTFRLDDIHEGPLERLDLQRRFDAVVAIDLLEHLPRPLETLRVCHARLEDGGALILQTPCYRGEQADWKMLVPGEHLFLYSEASVRALLGRAGFNVVEIGPSLFPHDMWIVACTGAQLARRNDPFAGLDPLVAGLITLYRQSTAETAERHAVEQHRSVQMTLASAVSDELEGVRADQRDKQTLITNLTEELATVRADQVAKDTLLTSLSDELTEVRADQRDKDALVGRLTRELDATRDDQQAKQTLIERVSRALEDSRADQRAKEALLASLTDELATVRADQRAKDELIGRVSAELEAVRADQQAKDTLIARLAGRSADRAQSGRDTGDPD